MKTRVLDSWAILGWMSGRQPVTGIVANLLAQAEAGAVKLLMSAINMGEVYYFLRKHHSVELAESWKDSSRTFPGKIETPTAKISGMQHC